jgi:hypothetical protein
VILGTLGSNARAQVDGRGRVTPEDGSWELDWWVGAEDRRHMPAAEAAVRQSRPSAAPIATTSMRVPGGDAVQRAYAVGGPGELVVVEVENASAVPFAVGFVLRGRPELVLPRPPLRTEPDGGGEALVYPVAHRTVRRIAVALGGAPVGIDVDALPDVDAVMRGWDAQLERGMRVDLPDPELQRAVDAARADLLLDRSDAAALEDWGFDDEAAEAWSSLSFRDRRRARRRPLRPPHWDELPDLAAAGPFLLGLRAMLVHDDGDTVSLVTDQPRAWRGQSLEVHDAPTRSFGRVSFAVRWHSDRPALLWECEQAGGRLRAPGLDPEWSTTDRQGEALLGAFVEA